MPEIFGKENSEVAQDTSLHGKFVKTMIKQRRVNEDKGIIVLFFLILLLYSYGALAV